MVATHGCIGELDVPSLAAVTDFLEPCFIYVSHSTNRKMTDMAILAVSSIQLPSLALTSSSSEMAKRYLCATVTSLWLGLRLATLPLTLPLNTRRATVSWPPPPRNISDEVKEHVRGKNAQRNRGWLDHKHAGLTSHLGIRVTHRVYSA